MVKTTHIGDTHNHILVPVTCRTHACKTLVMHTNSGTFCHMVIRTSGCTRIYLHG